MYFAAKCAQAAGLAIIFVGFVQKFPALMNPKQFLLGAGIFFCGWLIGKASSKSKRP